MDPKHMKTISDVISNSIHKSKEMQAINPKSSCLALVYKDLIDFRVIPKDCFDCANGKANHKCENIQFIESRYEQI